MTLSTLLSKLGVKVPEKPHSPKGEYARGYVNGYCLAIDELLSLDVPEPGVLSEQDIIDIMISVTHREPIGLKLTIEYAQAIHAALVERSK